MTQISKPEDFWIFGYGSLIWRPGFEFVESAPARLTGLHRALCVYSYDHRGTPEKPGLVLGLDRGGACRGVAFRVAKEMREPTLEYLREREQSKNVYIERFRQVTLIGNPDRLVRALVFCVDRGHPQYAGKLTIERQLHFIRQGHGRSGPNPEYVLSTVDALEKLGLFDRELHLLAQGLRGSHERSSAAQDF
jgi:glutathione-specific gamma-glutamylcyclotransferase